MQADPNEPDPAPKDSTTGEPASRWASGSTLTTLVVVIALAIAAQRWVLPAIGIGGG